MVKKVPLCSYQRYISVIASTYYKLRQVARTRPTNNVQTENWQNVPFYYDILV